MTDPRQFFGEPAKQNQNQLRLARRRFPALGAGQSHVFDSNSDWFIALFSSVAIDKSSYFCFGFYDSPLKTTQSQHKARLYPTEMKESERGKVQQQQNSSNGILRHILWVSEPIR